MTVAIRQHGLDQLQLDPGTPAVVNVRPYTALVLAALIPGMTPVWLWIDEAELTQRRTIGFFI